MVRDCPRCGLINPPEALRCDCGYDFASRRVLESYLTQKQRKQAEEDEESGRSQFGMTDIPVPLVYGTNVPGLVIIGIAGSIIWFKLSGMLDIPEGPLMLLLGSMTLVLDVLHRHFLVRRPIDEFDLGGWSLLIKLFEYERGGKLVFFPTWFLGLVWIVIGLFRPWVGEP